MVELLRLRAVKNCVQEEGECRLSPSSTWCCGCVRDEVVLRYRFHHHHVCIWLRLCGHRRMTVPGDINEHDVFAKGCGCFEVVVD